MSSESLYYASSNSHISIPTNSSDSIFKNYEYLTGIYKFPLLPNGKFGQPAAGIVPGWVNDQFSMSEYKGFLRIGTTRTKNRNTFSRVRSNTFNQLTILKQENNNLIVTGGITNIAPSERIYSMRYDKERAYMVTFRRTDPLFTFDLSNPYAPKILGELKVTGFSTYIHLFGQNNNRLLTIGRSATEQGRVTGTQIQIFNVEDLKNPTLVASYELGRGWSQALYDHHAFMYYAPKKILAIPWPNYSCRGFGSKIFHVTENSLTVALENQVQSGSQKYCWRFKATRRNVIVGNILYLISTNHINSINLENFKEEQGLMFSQ